MCNNCVETKNVEIKVEELVNIQTGRKIDMEKFNSLPSNAMLKVKPELWIEWDFSENDDINVYKITKGSDKKVWWICSECKSSFDTVIYSRTNGTNCPYCAGKMVNETNSLASLNPDIASQWHPTLNGNKTPNDVTPSSNEHVWWICENNHHYKTKPNARNSGKGCPYCSGRYVWNGYNDMWTTNPELASLLVDPEDGYKYMQNSNKKVDWKCPDCGEIIKDKPIDRINKKGLCCPICSDNMSLGEKIMYHLLIQLGIDFIHNQKIKWSNNKRYDFYIPSLNLIIETHGRQHSVKGFDSFGGRTLQEEQENDNYKRDLAIKNGIKHYIEIDCRYSDFDYIKNSVLNSELNNLFILSNVNWTEVNIKIQKSINYDILELWNKHELNLKEISLIVKIGSRTISKVLQNFDKLELCIYDTNRGRKKEGKKKIKSVYQFDSEMDFIKKWNSSSEIQDTLKYLSHSVNVACNKQKTYRGFIWRYEKDLIGWSEPINYK